MSQALRAASSAAASMQCIIIMDHPISYKHNAITVFSHLSWSNTRPMHITYLFYLAMSAMLCHVYVMLWTPANPLGDFLGLRLGRMSPRPYPLQWPPRLIDTLSVNPRATPPLGPLAVNPTVDLRWADL